MGDHHDHCLYLSAERDRLNLTELDQVEKRGIPRYLADLSRSRQKQAPWWKITNVHVSCNTCRLRKDNEYINYMVS